MAEGSDLQPSPIPKPSDQPLPQPHTPRGNLMTACLGGLSEDLVSLLSDNELSRYVLTNALRFH